MLDDNFYKTILLGEQNAWKALIICDYAYVLEGGKIVIEGPRDTLMSDAIVQRAYLGEEK